MGIYCGQTILLCLLDIKNHYREQGIFFMTALENTLSYYSFGVLVTQTKYIYYTVADMH
jgi:hypothetical protein